MASVEKRDQLISAGARVFPRLGYHQTTVEDVIRDAGVARATFYTYFSDKRDLFTAVCSRIIDEIVQRLEGGIDSIIEETGKAEAKSGGESEFKDQLSDLVEGIFQFIRRHRSISRVFLHDMVGVDRGMDRLYYNFQDRLIDQFVRLVDYGVIRGFFAETDRRKAAEFIVSGQMYVAGSFTAKSGKYPVEDVSRQFMEYQLNGLVACGPGRNRKSVTGKVSERL